jgi:hypothetical protein
MKKTRKEKKSKSHAINPVTTKHQLPVPCEQKPGPHQNPVRPSGNAAGRVLFTPAKNKRNRSATPANRNHHSRSSTAFYQGAIMPPSCLQPAVSTRQNRPLPELIFPFFFFGH